MFSAIGYTVYSFFEPVKASSANYRKSLDIRTQQLPSHLPSNSNNDEDNRVQLELMGVMKIEMDESNSWETIFKIITLILVTYGGIKFINKKFD